MMTETLVPKLSSFEIDEENFCDVFGRLNISEFRRNPGSGISGEHTFPPSEFPPLELLPPSYFAPTKVQLPGRYPILMSPSDFRGLMTPSDIKRKRPYPKESSFERVAKIPKRLDEDF